MTDEFSDATEQPTRFHTTEETERRMPVGEVDAAACWAVGRCDRDSRLSHSARRASARGKRVLRYE